VGVILWLFIHILPKLFVKKLKKNPIYVTLNAEKCSKPSKKRPLLHAHTSLIEDEDAEDKQKQGDVEFCKYLVLLQVCGFSCMVCTVLDLIIFVTCDWGAGHEAGWILFNGMNMISAYIDNNPDPKDPWNTVHLLKVMLCLAVVNGFTSSFFSSLLYSQYSQNMMSSDVKDAAERTVWLTGIPDSDLEAGHWFSLEAGDVSQVEKDIVQAIERMLYQKLVKDKTEENKSCSYARHDERRLAAVEVCRVIPALSKQFMGDFSREGLSEYMQEKQIEKTGEMLQRVARMQLSGSAFITFKDTQMYGSGKDLANMLRCEDYQGEEAERRTADDFGDILCVCTPKKATCMRRPRWFRRYSHFSFGRPPFSTVTLRCYSVPDPSNICWDHLHRNRNRKAYMVITNVLLFLFALVLTSIPVLTSVLQPVMSGARTVIHYAENLANTTSTNGSSATDICLNKTKGLQMACDFFLQPATITTLVENQAPLWIIQLTNQAILPALISVISYYAYHSRKTSRCANEFHMNLFYFIMNTVFLPILGGSAIAAITVLHINDIAGFGGKLFLDFLQMSKDAQGGVSNVDLIDQMRHGLNNDGNNIFFTKHVIGCTLFSSAWALLDPIQSMTKMWCRANGGIPKPWIFDRGYWYAWVLSIYVVVHTFGFLIPTLLPIGTAFFFLRYWVDKYTLQVERRYVCESSTEGNLSGQAWFAMKGSCGVILGLQGLSFIGLDKFWHMGDVTLDEAGGSELTLQIVKWIFRLSGFFFVAVGALIYYLNAYRRMVMLGIGTRDIRGHKAPAWKPAWLPSWSHDSSLETLDIWESGLKKLVKRLGYGDVDVWKKIALALKLEPEVTRQQLLASDTPKNTVGYKPKNTHYDGVRLLAAEKLRQLAFDALVNEREEEAKKRKSWLWCLFGVLTLTDEEAEQRSRSQQSFG
jgi:hypothetical protein